MGFIANEQAQSNPEKKKDAIVAAPRTKEDAQKLIDDVEKEVLEIFKSLPMNLKCANQHLQRAHKAIIEGFMWSRRAIHKSEEKI